MKPDYAYELAALTSLVQEESGELVVRGCWFKASVGPHSYEGEADGHSFRKAYSYLSTRR